jgi:heme-degrading monooxygenase HmoA
MPAEDGAPTGIVFTHGTWVAKPGREAEFVTAWTAFAEWTTSVYPGSRGTLLRDREEPRRFVSFGPWPSSEAAESWRAQPEFQRRVVEIRECPESFEPRTLDLVVEVE